MAKLNLSIDLSLLGDLRGAALQVKLAELLKDAATLVEAGAVQGVLEDFDMERVVGRFGIEG